MSYGKIYFIYYKVIRRSMKFLFSPAPLSRFNFLDTFFTSLSLISGCERKGSDNARVRACRVKLSFSKINGNRRKCAHRTRACDRRQNFKFL